MNDLVVAPERIYGWRYTQLSIARFYGGLTFNGKFYVIAPDEEGEPLVRLDVQMAKKKGKRNEATKEKQAAAAAQQGLNFEAESDK